MTEHRVGGTPSTATRVLASLTVITSWVAAVAVASMLVHIVAHTAFRYFGGSGLPGTLEYVRFWWLTLMVFGALASAQRRGDHISAPILFDRLEAHARRWWEVAGNTLAIVVVLLMAWYGWKGAMDQMAIGARASGTRVLTWPTAFLVPLGMALFALEIALGTVLGWGEREAPEDIAESSDGSDASGPRS